MKRTYLAPQMTETYYQPQNCLALSEGSTNEGILPGTEGIW